MRKRSTEVLASLCATHPKRAIVDALMDVKPFARGELEQLVDQLKSAGTEGTGVEHPRRQRANQQRSDGSPTARIKRLLTVEARLSSQQSMQELKSELESAGVPVPSLSKATFGRWLDQLIESVPAGEVLNAAMTIATRHRPN